MLSTIDTCPKPVIGRINGSAFGGGVGLVSVCDIAIGIEGAKFAFSEVRLGIAPATISPFAMKKIGVRGARELFLTGERFSAERAHELGLLTQVVTEEDLDDAVRKKIDLLLGCGPSAVAACKELIRKMERIDPEEISEFTANMIADLRASEEGKEGISSFLDKKKPKWYRKYKGTA